MEILAGESAVTAHRAGPMEGFSEASLEFVRLLSERLMGPAYRSYPGLAALGFWLRPRAIERYRRGYVAERGRLYRPAGTVLHLAPSNVDIMFAYSWLISLMVGNANIIRLSQTTSPERERLLELLIELFELPACREVRERTSLLSYAHDDSVTSKLSKLADRRVIWGGDETVTHLRSLPLPPLSQEIVFPDRLSSALFSAGAVIEADNLMALMEGFYRDSYGFNQLACSSPVLLMWLEDGDVEAAQSRFWGEFDEYVQRKRPALSDGAVMNKWVAMQSVAMLSSARVRRFANHRLDVMGLDEVDAAYEEHRSGGGLFFETVINDLSATDAWLNPRHQTLSYWGIPGDTIHKHFSRYAGKLPDRIVPVGQALDFDVVWDGMNLFERLSRTIRLKV